MSVKAEYYNLTLHHIHQGITGGVKMERRKWAVSYRERPGMPEKWAIIEAVTARGAADIVARSLPGYEITGVYKQMPDWAWQGDGV